MTTYCNAVRKLEKKFEGLELHHVPRLKNQAADELAKLGSTRRPVPSDVCLEHLHLPSVKEDPFTEEPVQPKSSTDPTEVDVPVVVDLVMEILAVIPDWTVPIIAYILRQELPEDEVQARQIVRRSKSFTVIDGQLYKESISGVLQRCISPEEGQLILEDIHSGTSVITLLREQSSPRHSGLASFGCRLTRWLRIWLIDVRAASSTPTSPTSQRLR